jgi:predicted dehydrogenase
MRVGLVGCGFIGTVHSFALRQLSRAGLIDAAVTATYDADGARAETAAAAHDGAAAMPDLDSLIDAVDVVWVCTWTAAHAAPVHAAVAARRSVFCEKPLAPTLAECETVAVDLRRVPHQVGLVLRYAPVFRAAADAVRSGRYGAPLAAILRDDQYFPIQGMYGSTWRGDVAKAGGGTLIEHSIHDVDVLSALFGGPEWVAARTACRFGHIGIDDVADLTLTYAGQVVATLVSVWHQVTTRPSTRRLEIFCEDAFLWTDDDYLGPLHVETSNGVEQIQAALPSWADRLGVPDALVAAVAQYAEPALAFLDTLARDGAAARGEPDVDVALAAHRVVDAAYRSAATDGAPMAVVPDAATSAR